MRYYRVHYFNIPFSISSSQRMMKHQDMNETMPHKCILCYKMSLFIVLFFHSKFCIFLTVVHDVKKVFGLDFVLYIVFLQEGAPSTWAWALPRPDSPIPRHKPRGLWQPPDRESGSQVSLHLPLHFGLPLNLPPSPFLGWEQGHLICDWPPASARRWSWSSQHQLIFLCLSILENTESSPLLSNAFFFFFFFACCATSQVKPRRQMYHS